MRKKQPDQPRKQPKQARSKLLVESLVQAARELLENDEFELTIETLCERTGISAGSFYQYFPNKEALLAEVFKSVIEKEWQTQTLVFEEALVMSFEDGIQHNAKAGIAFFRRLHQLEPAFYGKFVSSYLPFDSHEPDKTLIQLYEQRIEQLFISLFDKHPCRDTLSALEVEQMAFVYGRGSIALLHSIIEERPEYLYDEALMDRLTLLFSQQSMFS